MRYVLDADWIIQVLAGRGEAVLAHTRIKPEEIAVSYITIGEIYEVAFTYTNPQAHLHTFRQFLTPFPTLDLNEPIMERFAEIRAYLRRRGELTRCKPSRRPEAQPQFLEPLAIGNRRAIRAQMQFSLQVER